ncbi:MAG: ABA4-like family protein [Pseudomonadota bacterium]
MVDPDKIFDLSGLLAMTGWAILIFLPRRFAPLFWIPQFVIPLILGVIYAVLIVPNFASSGGGFGSIAEVRTLMQSDAALTAGWLHYLAFDLFVGCWIARQSDTARIPRVIQAAFLLATFMFGPLGLALFLLTRGAMIGAVKAEDAS